MSILTAMRARMVSTTGRRKSVRALIAAILGLAMMPLLSAPPATAAGLSESESNGTIATANALPVDGTVMTGASTGGTADADFFSFNLAADSKLNVAFKFPSDLGTGEVYNVDVYDSTGAKLYGFVLNGNNSDGSGLAAQAIYVSAGRGYLRVLSTSSWASWGKTYSVSITSTSGLVETEGNGTTATADLLALGSTISGSSLIYGSSDDDYYAIDLTADSALKIQLTFPDNVGTALAYDVDIVDASGAKLYGFNDLGTGWNGTWLANQPVFLGSGRWYLRISSTSSRASWGKSYSLTVTASPGLVETENNGTTATADQLPLASTIAGTSLLSGGRDDDYFTFSISGTQHVVLGFTFADGLGLASAYDLALYNSAGTVLWSSALTGTDSGGVFVAGVRPVLAGGQYYLKVSSASSRPTWGTTYNLRVDLALVTTTPKISGKVKVGKKLKVKVAAWSPKPVALSYQWLRSGAPIAGATKATYKLVKADKRKKISVLVTGTKAGYLAASSRSKNTKKVH